MQDTTPLLAFLLACDQKQTVIMMEDQHRAWALPLALEGHLNMALREAHLDKSTQRSTREKARIEMGL